jgi:hypothetical protein
MFKVLALRGEWIWLLYVSIIFLSAALGKLTAQYLSNPLNKIIRKAFV